MTLAGPPRPPSRATRRRSAPRAGGGRPPPRRSPPPPPPARGGGGGGGGVARARRVAFRYRLARGFSVSKSESYKLYGMSYDASRRPRLGSRLSTPSRLKYPLSAPRPPRHTNAPLSAPSTACPEVGTGRLGSAEAQLGERGHGIRVGGRLGLHGRLELRLGPGEG